MIHTDSAKNAAPPGKPKKKKNVLLRQKKWIPLVAVATVAARSKVERKKKHGLLQRSEVGARNPSQFGIHPLEHLL